MGELRLDEFGDRMIKLLPKLNIAFEGYENIVLTRHEITTIQLLVLEYISASRQCSMKGLIDDLKVKFPTVIVNINRLIKTGFVIRTHDKNHRMFFVVLSNKGKMVLREVNKQRRKVFTEVFSRVRSKQRDKYLAILEKLVRPF